MDKPRETSVKPHDTAAKSIKENPAFDATIVASIARVCDTRRVNKNGSGGATNTKNLSLTRQLGTSKKGATHECT